MENQDRTREKLARAIKEEMERAPLDKITVTQIVERAGVTRQTFYRNFQDKYDLVNWHFEQLAQRSFKQMGVSLTLREALIRKFQFLKGEGTFFTQAFRSRDHNSVVAYDYQCILEFYTGILQRKLGVEKLPQDIAFLLEMYCSAAIDKTVEWGTTGMERPIPELVDLLIEAMPQRLQELLRELQGPVAEAAENVPGSSLE